MVLYQKSFSQTVEATRGITIIFKEDLQ